METGPNENTGGWAKALQETLGGGAAKPAAAAPASAPARPAGVTVHPTPAGLHNLARS